MLHHALARQRISSTLRGSQFKEKTQRTFLSTGMKHLDLLLSGGIPRGQITEIVGPSSSGKTSLLLSILSQATQRGEVVAYVDSFSSLDPAFARKAGIDLQRLLWVRGGALKAVDILAQAGGFGIVVLDAGETLHQTPFRCWFRLKRAVQGTSTILLILGDEATAGSAASVVISLRRRKAQWGFTSREVPLRHACLLRGICTEVELLRGKNPNHATFYSHF
ncbi:MAG: ATPase domain-containing protein [Pseudomonadota bacterium]|nr:ATPase domain-containing protein [Pseudomonadota bacterium]